MIYLKYGTYSNGTKSWTANMAFNEIKCVEKKFALRVTGRTLTQRGYAHTLGHYSKYAITISADELATAAKMSFLHEFFNADIWAISLNNWVTTIEVILEENELKKDFVQNCLLLPRVEIELTTK